MHLASIDYSATLERDAALTSLLARVGARYGLNIFDMRRIAKALLVDTTEQERETLTQLLARWDAPRRSTPGGQTR